MAHVWSSRTLDAAELADLYEWLDRVPLSKARTNVEKDFADGYLIAEIVRHYFPELVDMREYRDLQNVKDRTLQWKQLNSTIFHKIGLQVPNHVITQLSIAKTGIAQILLYNLRASLTLYSASLAIQPVAVLADPSPIQPVLMRPPVYEDPLWYKYNMRYNLLKDQTPVIFENEYDYYWQKKQAERLLKSAKSRNVLANLTNKSYSHPSIIAKPPAILPRLPLRNAIVVNPAVSNAGLTAAKLEIDEKDQQIMEKDDEILFLRGQLKRMEVLLNNKNYKIQELQSQLEKIKPVKKLN